MKRNLALGIALFLGICVATMLLVNHWFSHDIVDYVKQPTHAGESQNPKNPLSEPKYPVRTSGISSKTTSFAEKWLPRDLIQSLTGSPVTDTVQSLQKPVSATRDNLTKPAEAKDATGSNGTAQADLERMLRGRVRAR